MYGMTCAFALTSMPIVGCKDVLKTIRLEIYKQRHNLHKRIRYHKGTICSIFWLKRGLHKRIRFHRGLVTRHLQTIRLEIHERGGTAYLLVPFLNASDSIKMRFFDWKGGAIYPLEPYANESFYGRWNGQNLLCGCRSNGQSPIYTANTQLAKVLQYACIT